jgi:flagellar biosynthesis protein FlhB
MSENSSAEQTEEPTARKLRNAREEGQVARSVELPAAAVHWRHSGHGHDGRLLDEASH